MVVNAIEKEELFNKYKKLVPYFLNRQYIISDLQDFNEDLMQEGYLAIMRAIDTYEEGHGTLLFSYIGQCVKYAIIGELRKAHRDYVFKNSNQSLFDTVNGDENPLMLIDVIENKNADIIEPNPFYIECILDTYRRYLFDKGPRIPTAATHKMIENKVSKAKEIIDLLEKGYSQTEAAKEIGISKQRFNKRLFELRDALKEY